MKDILKKYSPRPTPQNTGESDLYAQSIPDRAEATKDLHGYFLDEALFEAENFLERCCDERCSRIQIITGNGEVIKPAIKKLLQRKRDTFRIFKIEKHPGAFDIFMRPW